MSSAIGFSMPVVTNAQGKRACTAFASAKEAFQKTGITWIFQQTLLGNFDAINIAFERTGMLCNELVSADGKAVWKYLTGKTEDGGLGLHDIIMWDKASHRFRAKKNWRRSADVMDIAQAEHNLQAVLWYRFGKNVEPTPGDLDIARRVASIARSIRKAPDKGQAVKVNKAALREALADLQNAMMEIERAEREPAQIETVDGALRRELRLVA